MKFTSFSDIVIHTKLTLTMRLTLQGDDIKTKQDNVEKLNVLIYSLIFPFKMFTPEKTNTCGD